MTLLVEPYLWCALQVTLLAFFSVAIYLLIARRGADLSATVLLGSLSLVGVLTVLTLVPAPQWSWPTPFTWSAAQDNGAISLVASGAISGDVTTDAVAARVVPVTSARSAIELAIQPVQSPQPTEDAFLVDSLLVSNESGPAAKQTGKSPRAADGWTLRMLPWTSIVAGLVLVAVAAGVLRMIVALAALRAFRRSGAPVNEEGVNHSAAEISQRLGLRRLPQLRESHAVATPATIGWWRPIVLLPPDWREWTPAERAAVLAHEMAHIRLGHFAKWLFAQWVLVPHYYHPLVHWLVGRLRVEQELAADQHAARALGDQQRYAAALAALALRPAVAPPRSATLGLFMSHSLLTRRIKMLGNSAPKTVNRSRIRLVVLLVLLACGVGVSGIRGNRVAAQEQDASKAVEVVVDDVGVEVAEIMSDAEVAVDVQVDEVEIAADEAADPYRTEDPTAENNADPETKLLNAQLRRLRLEVEQRLRQIEELERRHLKEAKLVPLVKDEAMRAQTRALAEQHLQVLELEQQRRAQLDQARHQADRLRESGDERPAATLNLVLADRPTHQVTALLQVQHDDASTLPVARATQLALLESDFVLQAAIRDANLQQLEAVPDEDAHVWLRGHLVAEFVDNSEILQVRMLCFEEQVDEYRKIVDAVTHAFMNKVVMPARQQSAQQRDQLARAHARLQGEIRDKMADYQSMAKELGAADGQSNLEQELNLRRMDRLETEIMRLENEALLQEVRDDDSEEAKVKEKFYAARIDQLLKQRAELEEEMRARGEPSVDLKLRQAELQQLQETARQVGMQLEKMDVHMDNEPEPVRLIQSATPSRIGR